MVYTILLTENSNSNDIVIIKACETQLLLNLHFLFLSMFFLDYPSPLWICALILW